MLLEAGRGASVVPLHRSADGAAAAREHRVAGLRIREAGCGPDVLLLHGTAACGDSWSALLPALARRCRVLVPDLPGHGASSGAGEALSLDGMSARIAAALAALNAAPRLVVGHSAGAALAGALMLRGAVAPAGLVAVAPAMLPFPGGRQPWFSALAGVLAANPLVPRLVAWRARDRSAVLRLLRGLGSELDAAAVDRYAGLFRSRAHVASVLGMMARWDLSGLAGGLERLDVPVLLIAGRRDRAVPSGEVDRLQVLLPRADRVDVPAAGHLPHEERPEIVLSAMRTWALGIGVAL